METSRDPMLWRKAKKRAAFKLHLRTYLIINGGLWLIYLLTAYPQMTLFPWPLFPMLGWGIGLVSHYFTSYGKWDEESLVRKEYEKLQREGQGREF